LVLGPVLERNQNELLDPSIDNAFAEGFERGLFPDPPPEMAGMDVTVQYISMLAQAQKAVGIGSVDRIIGTIQTMGATHPEAFDKLSIDEAIDEYADMLGTPPEIIVPTGRAALVRRKRLQQQQQLQEAAQIAQGADVVKQLSETDTDPEGQTALNDVTQAFSQVA